MKLYINDETWPRMRYVVVRHVSEDSYDILFRDGQIRHCFIRYIQAMIEEHGEPYAGFVNRFSRRNLKNICEARFRWSYLKSVHEFDYENQISRYEMKQRGITAGFYNESFHYFKAKPKRERMSYQDFIIAGNNKDILSKESLPKRIVLYEDIIASPELVIYRSVN